MGGRQGGKGGKGGREQTEITRMRQCRLYAYQGINISRNAFIFL